MSPAAAPILGPVVVGVVTDQFVQVANQVLRGIQRDAIPVARAVMAATRWELSPAPSRAQLVLLPAPPQPGQVLLGLFSPPPPQWRGAPPTIALFEANIRQVAQREGRTLADLTHQVMVHELQHRFRLNHAQAPGSAAAAAPA